MIGTAIATGPAVRPFYNHGGVTPIIYTALGQTAIQDGAGVYSISLSGITVGSQDTLLLALVWNDLDIGATDPTTVTIAGRNIPRYLFQDFGGGIPLAYRVCIYSLQMAGTAAASASVAVDWTGGGAFPGTRAAMILARVSGLRQSGGPVDATAQNIGLSGDQDSGLTALPTQPEQFVWGIIATNGRLADTLGTWQDILTASQRASLAVGLDLKEGQGVSAVLAQHRGRVIGATARNYGALCATYFKA